MKNDIRILTLILLLLWALAWTAAGRAETFAENEPPADETTVPPQRAVSDAEQTLRVLHGGQIEEMALDDYLRGVLRAEMPASFEQEALKAQAIAARTYTLYKLKEGEMTRHPDADACDDVNCCKAYKTTEAAAADWGSMALYYEEKLARAVAETDGQIALYDGEPILAVFFSSAAGYTQNAAAVWQSDLPYLRSVSSPEDEELVPNYYSVVNFTPNEFRDRVLASRPDAKLSGSPSEWIGTVERNQAGFVTTVCVGGVTLKGNELRAMLGLRSPAYTIEADDSGLTFHVTGYGHGVGMSQYGANALAKQGRSAKEIIEHYYSGATVGTYETP